MRRDGSTGRVGDEIRDRLGVQAIGEARAIEAISRQVEGERLEAVGAVLWERRGWIMVASERSLRLVRRPRVFGGARDERFDWADLTAVRSGGVGVELTFGDRALTLTVVPRDELLRLLDTARRRLAGGTTGVPADELRALARRDLGRWIALGLEAAIDGLPDQLEPDERVERVAGATLDFDGLLVLTDRRLLLLSVGVRVSHRRAWSVARRDIRGALPVENGLWLDLGDHAVTLTKLRPPDRLHELVAGVLPRAEDET